MRLLLDTHILLWVMQGAPALSREARRLITAADEVFVSSVSLWEISVKTAIAKLKVDLDRLDMCLREQAFSALPVTWAHASSLRALPPIHGDPFDRMLIAQAVSGSLQLLTHDALLARYSPLVTVV